MDYTNDKIEKLISERDAIVKKYNAEIEKEIMLEKAKYRFSWKRFCLVVILCVTAIVMFELNKKIFPKTSLLSWQYYIGNY